MLIINLYIIRNTNRYVDKEEGDTNAESINTITLVVNMNSINYL